MWFMRLIAQTRHMHWLVRKLICIGIEHNYMLRPVVTGLWNTTGPVQASFPASILRKSTSGRHLPVSYPDGPMTARYTFT